MADFPSQISIQADIEIKTTVSGAIIDEFNRRSEGFMNLRVGEDISIYPNLYNLIILVDASGERDAILTQCMGFYDPEKDELAAGEVPLVYLTRNIRELPEEIMERLVAADPRVVEGDLSGGTTVIDVTDTGTSS